MFLAVHLAFILMVVCETNRFSKEPAGSEPKPRYNQVGEPNTDQSYKLCMPTLIYGLPARNHAQ